MDRRQSPRVPTLLPVRVWGVDAYALPFMQLASVRNISSGGAVLQGMQRQLQPGEILEVQFGEGKAQFRVVWVGKTGTRRQGEIGLESLAAEPCIWEVSPSRCSEFVGNG